MPVVPAAAALLLVALPDLVPPLLRPLVAAFVGVGLGAAVTYVYVRSRVEPLIGAAERVAAGERGVSLVTRRDELGRRLASAVAAIDERLGIALAEATVDPLTGVANRPAIIGALFDEVERSVRYRRSLCLMFVDIDHFKSVNDSYGHEIGDVVLRGVAEALRRSVRASDRVGRYGGEEFMVMLPETTPTDAAQLAEKLRLLIGGERWVADGSEIGVTISIGVTGGTGDRLSVEHLVREADAAMYSAKALGRDQVYTFEEPNDDSPIIRSPISPSGRRRALELGRMAHGAVADALAEVIAPLPSYRGRPSALIATIATTLGRQLSLPDHEIDKIRIAALLHDVGKVGVPQEILEKPAPLTAAEWRSVVQHPRIGQVILEQATMMREAVPIILHHHERFGGFGYPYGLRGNEIPLGARIVAIGDAYDAMIQNRPYKRSVSHESAVEELRRHAGSQFDPELVEIFCDIYGNHAPESDPATLGLRALSAAHQPTRAGRGASPPLPRLASADG
jgi:diguanylate cyclase (GGDEF)-like protein